MDRHLRQLLMETPGGRKYLADLDAAKKSKRARHAPSRKARTDKRAVRNARMAEIRERALSRALGRCELCGDPAKEAHHIIGGGLRRHRESVDTVLALCPSCHRDLHGGDVDALDRAEAYCRSAGMHDAAAALAKRLDKAMEARAARRTA